MPKRDKRHMKIYGYTKKMIWCDLTRTQIEIRDIADSVLEKYIGGLGLGTKILSDHGVLNKDPLAPDALLTIFTGPLSGTPVPTSGRMSIAAMSPATLSYGESDIGGTWGVRLKRAGFDGLVITGRSEHPVYIIVSPEEVRYEDSRLLWGRDTFETSIALKKKHGKSTNVLCIGQSGERLSSMAAIFSDGKHARAAGRGGFGAVMGAKNLKAIAIGDYKRPVPIFDEQGLKQTVKGAVPEIKTRTKALSDAGTAGGVVFAEDVGDLPIKNWALGDWKEGAARISGKVLNERMFKKKYFCGACMVGCGRHIESTTPYGGVEGGGPEYETLGSLGANCLVDDLDAIACGNELCNRLGVDTLSCGSAIAFAMEAYEKGLLTDEDVGYPLPWGDAQAMLRMVRDIGLCEGFGRLLTKGVRVAAQEIGQGSESFAVHVKGLEPPMHDPRACASLGLAYATNPNGPTHWPACNVLELKKVTIEELGLGEDRLVDRFSEKGKPDLVKTMQDYVTMFNSIKMCRFLLRIDPTRIITWFRQVTGIEHDLASFLTAGERISNLKKLYNVRLGFKKADDDLPKRILKEKRATGGSPDYLPNLEKMLTEYYRIRGWDPNGVPTAEKIAEVGLTEEASQLHQNGNINAGTA